MGRSSSGPRLDRSRVACGHVILYDNPWSGNCYKVRLLLSHLGYEIPPPGGTSHRVPASAETNASRIGKVGLLCSYLGLQLERRELSVVDRSNRPEVLGGLNPALRVPTVILDDGRVLAESGAITFYLAEGTPFLPEDRFQRAQVLQWIGFEQYDLEPNIAVARFWKLAGVTGDEQVLAHKMAAGTRALEAVDGYLQTRPYLVGDRYSLADICVFAYTHVADQGGFDLGRYSAINEWIGRVASQPGHISIEA
jgi:glutathione S-transferase